AEASYRVPMLEAYGMTEASHQMTSNPLPPGARVPGSVGVPTGTEVGVIDADGTLLPEGSPGEVVIRGPGVMAGYANNPAGNAEARDLIDHCRQRLAAFKVPARIDVVPEIPRTSTGKPQRRRVAEAVAQRRAAP